MAQSHEEVLQALIEAQRGHELSIIKLSEPLSGILNENNSERTSDVSADVFENPSPTSLEADLSHYKELFSKLRFSYLEQVTKEKFIRAIVGDPPLVVEHQENIELEKKLAISKVALKAQKIEVAELVAELEKNARQLCRKYDNIRLQTTQLQELPGKIEGLQASIDVLRASQLPGSDPNLNLPLEKTLALVEEREKERAELDRQLEQLQVMVPRKTRELDRLNAELQPLEVKRLGSAASAREAKRRREEALGGGGDDLEERGRWWRGVESGLKGIRPNDTFDELTSDEFIIQNECAPPLKTDLETTELTIIKKPREHPASESAITRRTLCADVAVSRRSLHIQKHTCSSCGYPAAKIRQYNWGEKAKRRKTTGSGRMRHMKSVPRAFKNGFQTGVPKGSRGPTAKAE
ncbi:hypothetical protein B7494_g5516 [Chlorociboria aeruginascens]|nr:hypothetical protein B7494_g5516 [Chlorociboria aeruginascens]